MKNMHHFFSVAAAVLLSSLSAMHAADIEGIAAIVNDVPITFMEVRQRWIGQEKELMVKEADKPGLLDKIRKLRDDSYLAAINEEIVVQEAKRRGMSVPPKFIDDEIKELVDRNFEGKLHVFEQQLELEGITLEQYRQNRIRRLLIDSLRIETMRGAKDTEEKAKLLDAWMAELRTRHFVYRF